MKYNVLLIVFLNYFAMAICLDGDNESLCYQYVRVEKRVKIGEGKYQLLPDRKPIAYCCPGYTEQNDICEPRCEPSCVSGVCVKPNVCECRANYAGPLCDTRICPAGYKGEHCKEKCSVDTFGENCKHKCDCQNGTCNPVNGYCNCHPGWTGITCSEKCRCLNGGSCNLIDVNCDCPPGFDGKYCEETCRPDYWGKGCRQRCDCGPHECNATNGQCESNCVNGEYSNKTCLCHRGWTGELCSENFCASGFYGNDCDQICDCNETTTHTCNRETGECFCKSNWTGERCEMPVPCPPMKFGQYCNNTCVCNPDGYDGCDPVSGKCNCKPHWTGETCHVQCACTNGICDAFGKCDCEPGWRGEKCEEKCENGFYGKGCNGVCTFTDLGNFICDHVIGRSCRPGFNGPDCIDPCPSGTYGKNCQNCSCNNASTCNRFTGECECHPGWYGNKCEEPCPIGVYGENCRNTCACISCRPTDGYCRCQSGWNGSLCRDYCPVDYFDVTSNRCVENAYTLRVKTSSISNATWIIISSSALLSLSVIVIITVYFVRTTKKREKKEIQRRMTVQRPRTSSNSYVDKEPPHIYEEIPETYSQDQYHHLVHIPVYDGYLTPKSLQPTQQTSFLPSPPPLNE